MIARYRVWDNLAEKMYPVQKINFESGWVDWENGSAKLDVLNTKGHSILLQSTGLKDIFKDDIVKFSLIEEQEYKNCTPPPIYTGVVKYNTACLAWMIECQAIKHIYPSGAVHMSLIIQGAVKVIGNLHANPGLLEGE